MADTSAKAGDDVTVYKPHQKKGRTWAADPSVPWPNAQSAQRVRNSCFCVGNDDVCGRFCLGDDGALCGNDENGRDLATTRIGAVRAITWRLRLRARIALYRCADFGAASGRENGANCSISRRTSARLKERLPDGVYAKICRSLGDSGGGQMDRCVNQRHRRFLVKACEALISLRSRMDGRDVGEVMPVPWRAADAKLIETMLDY